MESVSSKLTRCKKRSHLKLLESWVTIKYATSLSFPSAFYAIGAKLYSIVSWCGSLFPRVIPINFFINFGIFAMSKLSATTRIYRSSICSNGTCEVCLMQLHSESYLFICCLWVCRIFLLSFCFHFDWFDDILGLLYTPSWFTCPSL